MSMTNYLAEKLRGACDVLATHPAAINARLAAVRDSGKLITINAGLFPQTPQYDGALLGDDFQKIVDAINQAEAFSVEEAVATADRLLELHARIRSVVRAELAAIGQV